MRIYQSFFEASQKNMLDPLYYHLDNTENKTPLLREYPLLKKCFQKSIDDNIDLWGMFSWKFKNKMNLKGDKVYEIIKQNPDNDVYIFNSFFHESSIYYNIWEQGEYNHKNMIFIIENLFPKLNLDINKIYEPMFTDIMFFCCYCVANMKFWKGFFKIYDNYFNALNMIDEYVKTMHDRSAGYGSDLKLNFFPFIHERFFSHYININNFKVFTFHHVDKRKYIKEIFLLDEIKKEAILEKNKNKLWKWLEKRDLMYNLNLSNYLFNRCSW